MRSSMIGFLMLVTGAAFGDVEVGYRTYLYQVGGCKIEQYSWTGDAGDWTNWKFGKACTDKDVTWIEQKLKDTDLHDNFLYEVGAYFGGQMPEVTGEGPIGVPNGATFTGAAWAGHDGSGNFQSTFGTNFDASKLGSERRGGSSFLGNDDAARENLVRSGAAVIYAMATTDLAGELSYAGERVGVAWKAILHGGPPDLLSKAQLEAVSRYQVAQVQALEAAVVRQAQRLNTQEKDLVVAIETSRLEAGQSVSSAVGKFTNAAHEIQKTIGEYHAVASQVSTLTRIKAQDLHLPDSQIAALRAGQIPAAQLRGMEKEFSDKMEADPKVSIPALAAMQKLAEDDENPFRRQQLTHLVREFTDDRGLIAGWAAGDRTAQALNLRSQISSKAGKLVRENINEALGVKRATVDKDRNFRADVAMSLLQVADTEFAEGRNSQGARRLERARVMLDYLTNHPRVQQYATHTLSPAAQGVFGFTEQATSFEGHQIVDLAERLVAAGHLDGATADPDSLFLAVTTVTQMKQIAAGGSNLIGFIQLTETGNDLLDYLQGAAGGIRQIAVDTITGLQMVVNHPAASAEAVYQAVKNYDRTYQVIANKVQGIIDQYPTMSAAEKGALHAQIAADLVGAFTAVGAIKNVGTSVRAVAALGRASVDLTMDVVKGLRGARRLSTIAPELLDAFPFSGHNLLIGRKLLDAPESFIQNLRDYMEATQLSRKEAGWLARFREGGSFFVTETNYLKYINGAGATVGDWAGQFVLPTPLADFLQTSAAGSAATYRQALGWPNLASGTKLYRVDLPFKFEYSPQMPLGLEGTANAMFTGTGYTSGGYPELILYQAPKTDIVWKGAVGVVQ